MSAWLSYPQPLVLPAARDLVPRPGSAWGWRPVSTWTPTRGLTLRMGVARHCDGMSMNMYVINAILVLMVVRQIREHSLDLRALAVPVLAAAAVLFLHSVPGGGNDIALELLGVLAGAAMGAVGGLATRLRRGADGRPLGRAGAVAAGMWVRLGHASERHPTKGAAMNHTGSPPAVSSPSARSIALHGALPDLAIGARPAGESGSSMSTRFLNVAVLMRSGAARSYRSWRPRP